MPDVNITHLESDAEVEVVAILDDNGYADYLFINGETGELGVSGSVAGDRIYILDTDYESSRMPTITSTMSLTLLSTARSALST